MSRRAKERQAKARKNGLWRRAVEIAETVGVAERQLAREIPSSSRRRVLVEMRRALVRELRHAGKFSYREAGLVMGTDGSTAYWRFKGLNKNKRRPEDGKA